MDNQAQFIENFLKSLGGRAVLVFEDAQGLKVVSYPNDTISSVGMLEWGKFLLTRRVSYTPDPDAAAPAKKTGKKR